MSEMPAFVNLGDINSAFVVGFIAACILFGITCSQTVYYYRSYPGDTMAWKLMVGTLFVFELAHLMLVAVAGHHLYLVGKLPENYALVGFVQPTFSAGFALTVIITSIVQTFYSTRVWAVSHGKTLGKIAVGFILSLSFIQFVVGLVVTAYLYISPSESELHLLRDTVLYSVQLVAAMTCDIIISVSLVYFLDQSRSGFRLTENVVDRLIIYSVNVGLVTSAMAILTFVTFHAFPNGTVFSAFTEIISKFYVNSLLVTLNSRNSIRRMFNTEETTSVRLRRLDRSQRSHSLVDIV